jgi:putative DNA-invertase from lambdoid prophage Rac
MTAYGYMRVSKNVGMTVENQRPVLENWFKANGFPEPVYFSDDVSTRKERPERNRLFEGLKSGDLLACVRLDRWGRSTGEVIDSTNALVERGVRVVFINSGIDISKDNENAMMRFQIQIFAAFAELERELIRERTLEGLERARSEGKHLGRKAGSKDKKPRRKSGYWLRWEREKKNKESPLNKIWKTNGDKQSESKQQV